MSATESNSLSAAGQDPADLTPRPGADSGTDHRTPRWRTLMFRGFTRACPACGRRGLFRRSLTIVEDCPRCGMHFERIEGHWIGAIGMNTIVSFFMLMLTLVVGLVATFPDFPVKELVIFSVAVAIIHPILFQPTAQTLWCAIDLLMRKLEPHEVDWRFVSRDGKAQTPTATPPSDNTAPSRSDLHGEA